MTDKQVWRPGMGWKQEVEGHAATPAQPPASEADVLEAMFAVRNDHYNLRAIMTNALTAARSLGCLLPAEAAALSADRDAFHRQSDTAYAERDALAARLARAEEALGKVVATLPHEGVVTDLHATCVRIARAALTPPPSEEARPDAG